MISKKQLDYICKIWEQCYGENLKVEYQGFYKHLKRDIKNFKIYTDDTDEDKVLVGDDIDTALEILENNGYIIESEGKNHG
tara:strand:+ start:297 stop:539 length:243 start_codon:yes stop_codon:yes gene_type:complete